MRQGDVDELVFGVPGWRWCKGTQVEMSMGYLEICLIIKIKVSLRAMVVKLNCQTCRADMKEVMTWGKSKIEEIAFKNILIKYLACGGERYNVGGGGHPEQPMAQEQGAWVNPGRWGWMKPISHQGQQIGVTTNPCLIFFPAKVRLSTQRT